MSGFCGRASLRGCEKLEARVVSHAESLGERIQLGRLGRRAAARIHEPVSHMSS